LIVVMKLAFVLTLSLGTMAWAADDPVNSLPDSYKLQFENEWVKVVRVTYAPHAKLPAHAHTTWAAAYVYLNDSGPVIFKHVDKDYHAITRPATKARSFRLYRAVEEQHEVENTSDLASEFLRVEFKTEPRDTHTLRGRFYSEPDAAGERAEHLQFDNAQLRVTRLMLAPLRHVRVTTTVLEPALLIAVTPAELAIVSGSREVAPPVLALGQARWIDVNTTANIENRGPEPIEILRFDLKTAPVQTTRNQ
jgi:hypothetical protein